MVTPTPPTSFLNALPHHNLCLTPACLPYPVAIPNHPLRKPPAGLLCLLRTLAL
jgi:hypothetical protein